MTIKPEKKNRIISIFSAIITAVSLVIIILLLINYLNVKAENEELRSQLEETSLIRDNSCGEISLGDDVFYYA